METLKNVNYELADWQMIYEVVSNCGKAHHPRSFAIDMVHELKKIIDFNQSIVYFLDAAGNTYGQYTRGVADKYGDLYLRYHEAVEGEKYSFGDAREDPQHPTIILFDWHKDVYYPKPLMDEFIHSRKLTYSCDFGLYDLNGNYRLAVSLDRTKDRNFSEKELTNVLLAIDQLNSIYKNFFYRDEKLGNVSQDQWAQWKLTAREIEIVDLISQGVKPQGISDTLYISIATTYKHIQHIHEKMGVTNNQELMVKLLGQTT